jgi:hypothetical protein
MVGVTYSGLAGGRKQFFFEKKNQKTFIPLSRRRRISPRQPAQKFFASFFQKRRPSTPA